MQNDPTERHKQITRYLFEEVWNQANFDGLDELISPGALFHIRGHTAPMGPAETRQAITRWHSAFPDFHFAIEEIVAEGDTVAVRLTLSGTHQGPWKDRPPTGRPIAVTAMMFLRFEGGKLAEIWEVFDEHAMRRQLGFENH